MPRIEPRDHSPGRILSDLLLSLALVHAHNTSVANEWRRFVDFDPDKEDSHPRRVACITTSAAVENTIQVSARNCRAHGVQVLVSTTVNNATAYAQAEAIAEGLKDQSETELTIDSSDYTVHRAQLVSGPIRIGRSTSGRFRWSLNYLLRVTQEIPAP